MLLQILLAVPAIIVGAILVYLICVDEDLK
jgi:hypothetical protein